MMKKTILLFLFLSLTFGVDTFAQNYCQPSATYKQYNGLRQVTLNTINNYNNTNSGYANYTNQSTELIPGQTYTIKFVNTQERYSYTYRSWYRHWWGGHYHYYTGYSYRYNAQRINVWIDFNGNGTFDSGEKVVNKHYNYSTSEATFTVPTSGINVKNARMRIKTERSDMTRLDNPCATATYGETEDYTVSFGSENVAPVAKAKDVTVSLDASGNAILIMWN